MLFNGKERIGAFLHAVDVLLGELRFLEAFDAMIGPSFHLDALNSPGLVDFGLLEFELVFGLLLLLEQLVLKKVVQ